MLLSVDYRFRLGDGTAGWVILAGDWDYSGADSVGLYRTGYFYLTNTLDGSLPRPFLFGPTQAGWLPLSGDWNSDGTDSIGVYNQSIWRLRNANSAGAVELGFNFGAREVGWIPVASYRGGSAPLMALASAANVHTNVVSEPTVVATQPTVLVITPEFTQEVSSAEVTPDPTSVPTLEASPEITVEPTIIVEPTIEVVTETPIPAEATIELQPEVTQASSEP